MKTLAMQGKQAGLSLVIVLLMLLVAAPMSTDLYAHGGGTPRLTSVPVGPYRLYAWSEPEPWRVGEVHLSLAVTMPNPDSTSNQIEVPVTDVQVLVTYSAMNGNEADTSVAPIVVEAVRQEFLSNFYYESDPTLIRVGEWQVNVDLSGPEGTGNIQFAMETLPPQTVNWTMVGGAAGALIVALALLAVWSRSQQPNAAQRPTPRGARRRQNAARPVTRSHTGSRTVVTPTLRKEA
jgi:hypothetical protein